MNSKCLYTNVYKHIKIIKKQIATLGCKLDEYTTTALPNTSYAANTQAILSFEGANPHLLHRTNPYKTGRLPDCYWTGSLQLCPTLNSCGVIAVTAYSPY